MPAAPRARRRFVQEGEVPVVVITPRHPRAEQERAAVTELEHALAAERDARQAAEKALQRAEATIRQLQTHLAHAEIARREATPAPVPAASQSNEGGRPKTPQRRNPIPTEDEPVAWWEPGWRERFRTP